MVQSGQKIGIVREPFMKVSSVLCKVFAAVFAALFFWVLLLAIVHSAVSDYYLPLALAPALVLLLPLLWKKGRAFYRRIPDAVLTRVFLVLCAVALVGMLYVSYRLRLTFGADTWDFARIHTDAYAAASGEGEIPLAYYVKYQNNQLLLLILSLLAKLLFWLDPHTTTGLFHQCAMALNCVSILAAVLLTFFAVKHERGAHFAFLGGLMLLFYTPLWLYTPIYYTDTMGLPLIVLPLFLYTRLRAGRTVRNIVLFALIGIVAAVGMKMKVSIVFILIAISLCTLLFDRLRGKWYLVPIGVVCLLLTSFALQAGIDKTMRLTEKDYDTYSFPYSHWVMMSFGKSGGYDAELVKYTASFYTMEDKKEAVAEKTKELLEERGFAGTVRHIFVTKVRRTWGNGTLSATYYLDNEPVENGVLQQLFTPSGKYFRTAYYGIETVHLLFLFFIVLSGMHLFRHPRGGVLTIMRVNVFGLLLFLLVWECNARYLVHISPFLIMTAADGMSALGRRM